MKLTPGRLERPVDTRRRIIAAPLALSVAVALFGLCGFSISPAATTELRGYVDVIWQALLGLGGAAGFLGPRLPTRCSTSTKVAIEAAGCFNVAVAAAVYGVVIIGVNGTQAAAGASLASLSVWIFAWHAISLWADLAAAVFTTPREAR